MNMNPPISFRSSVLSLLLNRRTSSSVDCFTWEKEWSINERGPLLPSLSYDFPSRPLSPSNILMVQDSYRSPLYHLCLYFHNSCSFLLRENKFRVSVLSNCRCGQFNETFLLSIHVFFRSQQQYQTWIFIISSLQFQFSLFLVSTQMVFFNQWAYRLQFLSYENNSICRKISYVTGIMDNNSSVQCPSLHGMLSLSTSGSISHPHYFE